MILTYPDLLVNSGNVVYEGRGNINTIDNNFHNISDSSKESSSFINKLFPENWTSIACNSFEQTLLACDIAFLFAPEPVVSKAGCGVCTSALVGIRTVKLCNTLGKNFVKSKFVTNIGKNIAKCLGIVKNTTMKQISKNSLSKISKKTNLYRAVNPCELADINSTGKFINRGMAEGKYFATKPEGAASYAKQAVKSFGHEPYTLVSTKIPSDYISPIMKVTVDGGVSSVFVPDKMLPRLKPVIHNCMPLP